MKNTTAHLTRQLDIIPVAVLGQEISIIGAGAIGSCVAMALAKMGFGNLWVWDFDNINIENMNCQFYRHKDIGRPKVEALVDIVQDFSGEMITPHVGAYDGKHPLSGIVITAVDSMKARKMIWEGHKNVAAATKLYIDPRMGAERALCYAVKPMKEKDIVTYEKTLYSDAEAVFERCTAKATMYTAFMLSGHVAKIVKDFVCGKAYARVTDWDIESNVFHAYPAEV